MDSNAIWQLIFLGSAAAYWPAGPMLFAGMERLVPDRGKAGIPPVSIIIPARNEERNIPGLLDALVGFDPPPLEIVVVNDRSGDATAELVRLFPRSTETRIRLIESQGPPPGWTGKSYACHLGAGAAKGELLLFLDADVLPSGFPSLLSELYGCYLGALADGGGGALVSVQPFHRMEKPLERFSLFFNLAALAGSRDLSCFGWRQSAGAFGPCMFTGAAVYRATGGHEAIRGEVVDDLALAGLYRKAAYPVRALAGDRRFSFRMYPQGLRQLIEGWTKNMATGAGGAGGPVILLLVLWVTGMVNAVCALVYALAAAGEAWTAAAALVLYLAWAGQIFLVSRKAGSFGPASALLFPLHLLFFTAVFFRSLFSTFVRGSVAWRGRRIPVGRRRRR